MIIFIVIVLGTIAAFVLLRRTAPQVAPLEHRAFRKKTPDTPECRTAVHEAGHTVAAWSCTIVQSVLFLTVEAKGGGRVNYRIHSEETPDGLWCHLVISLAGIAAEIAIYGKTRSRPAESDLLFARGMAAKLEKLNHLDPPWDVPERGTTLLFEKMYAPPLSNLETIILKRGYHMAHHVVHGHGHRYHRVVSMLLTKKSAREADATSILGQRVFVQLAGVMRPTFILPREKR